jgi:hypothetical protein
MKSFAVNNIKVAHDGDRAEPSKGGSREPYFLFSGKVSLEFLEKRDIRIFTKEGRKTLEGYTLFEFRMKGRASLPSGLSEEFSYASVSNGNGFTVKPASVDDDGNVIMTSVNRYYVPVCTQSEQYPEVCPWGKTHEKAVFDPKDRSVSPDNIHKWLLPGWTTDWNREQGGFQKKIVYTPDQWQAAFNPLGG